MPNTIANNFTSYRTSSRKPVRQVETKKKPPAPSGGGERGLLSQLNPPAVLAGGALAAPFVGADLGQRLGAYLASQNTGPGATPGPDSSLQDLGLARNQIMAQLLGGADLSQEEIEAGTMFDIGFDPADPEAGPQAAGDDKLRGIRDRRGVRAGSDQEDAAAAAEAKIQEIDDLTQLADMITDPVARQLAIDRRDQAAAELQEIATMLETAQTQARVQDLMFEYQAARLGLDPEVGSLSEALDAEGGVGAQTLDAIMAVLNDPDLSSSQKQDTIDLLSNRLEFGGAVVEEIETLLEHERIRQDILNAPQGELITDEVAYLNPLFSHSLEIDPLVRIAKNFEDAWDQNFPEFDASLNPEANELLISLARKAMSGGVEAGDPEVLRLATLMQATPREVMDALGQGARRAIRSEESLSIVDSDPDRLEPGSEELMYAAQKAALEVGMSPVQAQLFANSQALHTIINLTSEGQAGYQGVGTIRGVGALSEDTYLLIMGEDWSPDKGMLWELTALAGWVTQAFGGNMIDAVNYYMRTGDWGGPGALPGAGQ